MNLIIRDRNEEAEETKVFEIDKDLEGHILVKVDGAIVARFLKNGQVWIWKGIENNINAEGRWY